MSDHAHDTHDSAKPATFEVRILRQDGPGQPSYWERHEVPYEPDMNDISVLQRIAARATTADGKDVAPVAWECNCLEEVCGACTMVINGRVRQSCSALVDRLLADNPGEIELQPMGVPRRRRPGGRRRSRSRIERFPETLYDSHLSGNEKEYGTLVKKYNLKGPKIVVEPPGPKAKKALARKEKCVTNGIRIGLPTALDVAEGPFMRDVDGNVFLDFTVGIGVHNCGHRAPEMVKACQDQLDKFIHICVMVTPYEPYLKLAEEMAKICPGNLTKSIFLNSGSEAIENAVKIARAYNKKKWIVSYKTSLHGRTFLDISLTGKEKPYKEGFGPLVPYIQHVDYGYCYRCPPKLEYPSCNLACVDSIRTVMETKPLEGDVCALVAEPIQGEGGFINPPPGYCGEGQEGLR